MQYPKWIIDEVRRNKINLRGTCAAGTAGDLHAKAMHTVCDEAKCPNKGKCFSEGEATFMILGDICTRKCAFCAVAKDRPPLPPDPEEPRRAAELCRKWNLKYVVYTSPTRDDLPDGGAWQFAETTRLIKQYCPGIRTEPLIPDFAGKETALKIVLASSPDVLGHNIEMPASLYGEARKGAQYERSLKVLRTAKELRPDILTKSAIILGLGEKEDDLLRTMRDLVSNKCDLLVLGQYLAPSNQHHIVKKYYTPEEFAELKKIALSLGFKAVMSQPLARSSFMAGALYREAIGKLAVGN